MKKILLIIGLVAASVASASAQKMSAFPAVSAVGDTDLFFTDQFPGSVETTYKLTQLQEKTYILGGGNAAIASGKTLTISNTLTFTGTDSSSVNFGGGGAVIYSLGIGSLTEAWSTKLDTLAGTNPFTAGSGISFAGTWPSLTFNATGITATASGTNTYTATPSPALATYVSGMVVTIRFTNGNTGGSSLNLNGLGAIIIQKDGVSITSGQLPANTTASLIYDGTYFQLINSGNVIVSGSQNITAISSLTTNGLVTTSGGAGALSITLPTALTATGDVTGTLGGLTVVALNGTNLAGLATGLLMNTTATGAPSIAVPGADYIVPHAPGSPTIAGGAGAGSSPTISITGSDVSGVVSVTPGSSPATAATIATVTFNTAFGATPNAVILTPANAATAALGVANPYVSSISTANFVVTSNSSALTASAPYAWYYFVTKQ